MLEEYVQPNVIAEIGCNHKGDMVIAKQLLDIAAESGIDFTVDTLEARARTLPHVGEDTLEEARWARWGQSEEGRRWAMNVWVKL